MCITNLNAHETTFFTHSLIGSKYDRVFHLTNLQVALMGLRENTMYSSQSKSRLAPFYWIVTCRMQDVMILNRQFGIFWKPYISEVIWK